MPQQWSFSPTPRQPNYRQFTLRMLKLLIIPIGILMAVLIYTVYSNESACRTIEGSTYRSPREVDNFFGGTMHPEVSFGNGTFGWVTTDVLISGAYECESGRIIAYSSYSPTPETFTGQLDPNTGNLLWYGDVYVKISR